jgi:hypothetical protein
VRGLKVKGEESPSRQSGHGVRPGLDGVPDGVVLVGRDPDGLPGEGDVVVATGPREAAAGTCDGSLEPEHEKTGGLRRQEREKPGEFRDAMLHQGRSGSTVRCERGGCRRTARTARRDLSALTEMGIIAVKREGRLRRYVLNPSFRSLRTITDRARTEEGV